MIKAKRQEKISKVFFMAREKTPGILLKWLFCEIIIKEKPEEEKEEMEKKEKKRK